MTTSPHPDHKKNYFIKGSLWLRITTLFFGLVACQTNGKPVAPAVITRDTTITQANAYSDLFFDSTRLEAFVIRSNWHDSLKAAMRSFYNARNYQYAWLTAEGFTEQVSAFNNMLNEYLAYSRDSAAFNPFTRQILDSAEQQEPSLRLSDSTRFAFEVNMTASFLRYARRAYQGNIPLRQQDLNWFIPRKQLDLVAFLDSFTKAPKGLATEPVNPQYQSLKKYLLQYDELEKKGGFPLIPAPAKSYRAGDSSANITLVKRRLSSSGDFTVEDTSSLFSNALKEAVMQFQRRHGLKEDGVVGGKTLRFLNEPIQNRIEQILVNMERMRWVPAQPQGDYILVNIPQYRLAVFENGKPSFAMNIVVGTSQNRTVIFTGNLKYVVFSPYWNVPPGILKNEVLPAIRRDPSYLERNRMEMANGGVRQKPGPWNALGKVKFLFPNQYNIYLHDTPSKNLFGEESRSFSHGCIRVAEPQKLAEWVLRKDSSWTRRRIEQAMDAGKEKYLTVKDTIRVYIAYFTAWVDDKGKLNFRDDVYGHDKKLAEDLFTNR